MEVKFQRNQIGKSIIEEMQEKINKISAPKRMSYRSVLVHVNGISEDLEDEKYFDHIFDFSDMLINEQ